LTATLLVGFLASGAMAQTAAGPPPPAAVGQDAALMDEARRRLAQGLGPEGDRGERVYFDPAPLGPPQAIARPADDRETQIAEPAVPLPPEIPAPVIHSGRNATSPEPSKVAAPGIAAPRSVAASREPRRAPKRAAAEGRGMSTEAMLARDLGRELSVARRQMGNAIDCLVRDGCR
jgi:hypothetical protein